jgi:hypothetical protein
MHRFVDIYVDFCELLQTLAVGTLLADGIGFSIGPFSLGFDVFDGPSYSYGPEYVVIRKRVIDNPICDAISNLNRLSLVVETREEVSPKEKKMATKRLIIEPYLLGVTPDGKLLLRGNTVQESLIKEITIKLGDEGFDSKGPSEAERKEGFFSGMFKSENAKPISIQKISQVQVLGDHFALPKNYKGNIDKNVRVICEIPVKEEG